MAAARSERERSLSVVVVARFDVSPSVEEEGYRPLEPVCRCARARRAEIHPLKRLWICALLEQQLYHTVTSICRREEQRRPMVVGPTVYLGPTFDKQFDNRDMSFTCRPVQRCQATTVVLSSDPGALVKQQLDHCRTPFLRSQ